MKKLAAMCVLCLVLLTACGGNNQTEEHALERLNDYAHAIDYDYKTPEKIYPFLCQAFRDQMSEEEFCEAFAKERSYPYITALYISKPQITMAEDGLSGTAVYDQAARIIGMVYEVEFVYENGDYYIVDWEEFLDGSYLEKFETVNYSLDWYYSEDVHADE